MVVGVVVCAGCSSSGEKTKLLSLEDFERTEPTTPAAEPTPRDAALGIPPAPPTREIEVPAPIIVGQASPPAPVLPEEIEQIEAVNEALEGGASPDGGQVQPDVAETPSPIPDDFDTDDIEIMPGMPVLADESHAIEDFTLIDATIGQVNGEPIYASRFLRSLDARLAAEARRMNRETWRVEASQLIGNELNGWIINRLFLREAESNLSAQERFGVLYLVESIRQSLRSRNRGSAFALAEALEGEGQTEQERVQDIRDERIIQHQFQQQIEPRVKVTQRDVKREYSRRYNEFNPNPVAHFRIIRITSTNEPLVEQIQIALEAGNSFDELADIPENQYERESGGRLSREFAGEYAEQSFFGSLEVLNDAARKLEPGEFVGPVASGSGSSTRWYWVRLEKIERPPALSLEDVQLQLEDELRARARLVAQNEFIDELRARGSFTDINDMIQQLVEIAEQRYYPDQQ